VTADIHTLAGPYALDALPEEERRFFEGHLEVCAGCRQEVGELHATAARLGAAATTEPPSSMKERVMSEVATTRQVRLPVGFRPQPTRWRRLLVPVAAALGLVVIALGFVIAQLNQQIGQVEANAEQVRQILTAADVTLAPLDAPSGTVATFTYSPEQDRGVFVAQGLAAVEPAMTYELWVISEDQPRPAGLFIPDDRGEISHLVLDGLGDADALGVTIEPEGGSAQPTGEILIFGEL
jgi:anti-sigma-K factor RskA